MSRPRTNDSHAGSRINASRVVVVVVVVVEVMPKDVTL
jgi:hypothetical protein